MEQGWNEGDSLGGSCNNLVRDYGGRREGGKGSDFGYI